MLVSGINEYIEYHYGRTGPTESDGLVLLWRTDVKAVVKVTYPGKMVKMVCYEMDNGWNYSSRTDER